MHGQDSNYLYEYFQKIEGSSGSLKREFSYSL
jgi:hypothetical protein